jgi:predicted RNase H-like HicB family nuclease
MKIKVIVHKAEEGGYWADVPSIKGCFTQAESYEELIPNIYEAVEGCLQIDIQKYEHDKDAQILELAI